MAEENEILKKFEALKKDNPFKVPKDYFSALPNDIMERIKTEEQINSPLNKTGSKESKTIWMIVRNQMAIAASFAALFLLAYTAIRIINPDPKKELLSTDAIFVSLEDELYYIDENTLIEYATENPRQTDVSVDALSDQEIIEYLASEGVDLDLLTDF